MEGEELHEKPWPGPATGARGSTNRGARGPPRSPLLGPGRHELRSGVRLPRVLGAARSAVRDDLAREEGPRSARRMCGCSIRQVKYVHVPPSYPKNEESPIFDFKFGARRTPVIFDIGTRRTQNRRGARRTRLGVWPTAGFLSEPGGADSHPDGLRSCNLGPGHAAARNKCQRHQRAIRVQRY